MAQLRCWKATLQDPRPICVLWPNLLEPTLQMWCRPRETRRSPPFTVKSNRPWGMRTTGYANAKGFNQLCNVWKARRQQYQGVEETSRSCSLFSIRAGQQAEADSHARTEKGKTFFREGAILQQHHAKLTHSPAVQQPPPHTMGAFLSTPRALLNLLLPFTNANTPLLQDLIHTIILCGTLYYAPQIAEYYNSRQFPQRPTNDRHGGPDAPTDDLPIDNNLVLQPDTDDGEELGPPPFAPTPPPNAAHVPPPQADHIPPNDAAPADPGPAERPRPTPANRIVGTKKAKSLARKDQRRAYHEFHRQEAELRRLREEEGKDEREAALLAEKLRRADVEREIAESEREVRGRKKEEERREFEKEQARRERVVQQTREGLQLNGAVDLEELAFMEGKDRLWIERLIRASGLLSQTSNDGSHTMITDGCWLVRIDAELMQEAYAEAVSYGDAHGGKVSYENFGSILEKAVKARATATASA
ncbi:hypothetical protein BDV95DRAFT_592116 [Massariosphaeria phaeospora]|uniref:Uncharacterized protein n=1 Tax=Massariosphaeria phaeospora TaxID=100035 RepID=A0A7C8MBE2_9PLEO|nr:hypothetical protein BDV95DRAFT_592116 [Massariosphaeria phaeospora]